VTEPLDGDGDSMVAIVGMSGRFPGAADVGELWRNLLAGTGGLREITDAELAAAGVDPADREYVRVGGPVDGLEEFDAAAFGLSDREAETMEPHHRLLLECSWEALERAGYTPTEPGPAVGVFAGCAFPDYMITNVPGLGAEPGGKQLLATGVERDSLTSLVSYKLGLHGPSLTVQTYCSTSLVAVHLACQSLLTYECDMALAGGANLPLPQPAGYRYEDGGILSPDGRVRSLDADANGTVMGAGVAVVALKRLADALADGDVVHAVILGSAVNNDGRERAGYSAPGVGGQAAVIDAALAVAGVKPESVGYVECHAVGTPLGDSIELAALNKVFTTPRESPCVLSSVKPSIGHLDRAAGVTGLVRAALSLRHETLPGVPGFRTPNPALAQDRFTVLTENRPWPAGPDPRRAGVSSFGVGGTNAHVVLEQAPPREARPPRSGPHLLTFSAGDPAALAELTRRLREHLVARPDEDLSDVAYTLGVSRGRFALRRAVICRDHTDAVAALADPNRWLDGETRRRDPRVRLIAGDSVPAGWFAELSSAVRRLLPVSGSGDDPLAVLAAGLGGIGVRLHEEPGGEDVVVAPGKGSAADWLLTVVARLWQAGSPIDWAALHRGAGRRVELPTYPFQRRRHWIEPSSAPSPAGAHLPTWRLSPRPVADLDFRLRAAGPWLLFGAEELADRLVHAGAEVVTVRPGTGFESHETGDFTIRPAHPGDLAELLASLVVTPRTIVHGFSLASPPGEGVAHFRAAQEFGAESVSALTEALAGVLPAELVLLTSGATGVLGADLTHPEHAALVELDRRHVDMDAGADADQVLAGMIGTHEGPVAVRGDQTWSRHHEPHELASPTTPPVLPGEVVLVTGGGVEVTRNLESLGATVLTEVSDGIDVVVHVVEDTDCATVVEEFHALQAALGDQAMDRRVALCSTAASAAGAVLAAYARAARNRGQGRWVVAAGDGVDATVVLAAGHLTSVVISKGPVVPSRPATTGDPAEETGERVRRPRPTLATPYVEPDAGLERTVANLVATALGLETIGADDNFFELGGRSAAAVQMAVRLRDDHAADLPLTALVEHPTVRLLCAEITAMSG
jgi:acyl transferase domain-containing protein